MFFRKHFSERYTVIPGALQGIYRRVSPRASRNVSSKVSQVSSQRISPEISDEIPAQNFPIAPKSKDSFYFLYKNENNT